MSTLLATKFVDCMKDQAGTIKYYNSKLDKYLLAFDDGSDDLFREEDIDDVELFFVDKPKRSQRVDYSAMAKGH